MLHNRLAMSKTERQSEAEKRHGKVLIVKKEIEELMQNYKYLYSIRFIVGLILMISLL